MGFLDDIGKAAGGVFGLVTNPIATIGSAIMGANSAQSANQQNVDLANTAHQREVADLKAAGLNPILSAGGGGASSPNIQPTITPSGAMDVVKQAATLGLQNDQQKSQIANTQANTDLANASTGKVTEESFTQKNLTEKSKQDAIAAKNFALASAHTASIAAKDDDIKNLEVQQAQNQLNVDKSFVGKNVLPWIKSSASAVKDVPITAIIPNGSSAKNAIKVVRKIGAGGEILGHTETFSERR